MTPLPTAVTSNARDGDTILTQNSEETVAGRTQNLKPWPKGVSGNPGGRPKRKPIEEALLAALTPAEAQAVAKALIWQAKRGNVRAFDSLADRVDGKVPQAVMGDSGGPLTIAARLTLARERLAKINLDEMQED